MKEPIINIVPIPADSINKPDNKDIKRLQAGDYVQLVFQPGERMWVKITEIYDYQFVGILDNEPIAVKSLKCGDRIDFEDKHIIKILNKR